MYSSVVNGLIDDDNTEDFRSKEKQLEFLQFLLGNNIQIKLTFRCLLYLIDLTARFSTDDSNFTFFLGQKITCAQSLINPERHVTI